MLIGITLTLAELEKRMEDKLIENQMKEKELRKEYTNLLEDMKEKPPRKGTEDDRPMTLKLKEEKIEKLLDENDFLKKKLAELDEIEKVSKGEIKKDEKKITLSLNDCLKLGITP